MSDDDLTEEDALLKRAEALKARADALAEVAEIYGRIADSHSQRTLHKEATSAGIKARQARGLPHGPKPKLTDEMVQQARAMLAESRIVANGRLRPKWTVAQVAKKFNVVVGTLKKYGLVPRAPLNLPDNQDDPGDGKIVHFTKAQNE